MNVRLTDWHIWNIVATKIPGKVRDPLRPADFNTEEDVRRDTEPHGWAAKKYRKKTVLLQVYMSAPTNADCTMPAQL